MRPITLIVNPVAGRGRARRVARIASEYLSARGARIEVVQTVRAMETRRLAFEAIERGSGIVAAVGGDGTIRDVASAVMDAPSHKAALGIVPAGTGNDIARSTGIQLDVRAACDILLDGSPSGLDIVRIEGPNVPAGSWFLGAAGLGFFADTARTVHRVPRFMTGKAAYLLGAAGTILKLRPFPMGIRVDGRDLAVNTGILVVISNVPTTGGGLKVAPEADPADGLLDVVFIGPVGRIEFLRNLPRVIDGSYVNHPAVVAVRGRRIEIETASPKDVSVDGDIAGQSPLIFQTAAEQLPAMLPVVRKPCPIVR